MGFDDHAARILEASKKVFGETVTYKPKSGGEKSITAIFDEAYERVDFGGGAVAASLSPALGIRLSDLDVAPAEGDAIVARGKEYRVIEHQPDGRGGAMLILGRK